MSVGIVRQSVDAGAFNDGAILPYDLRLQDFQIAMRDVYDFFHDVNSLLVPKGLHRLDDMLRPAILSGVISDMLTASLARHSRGELGTRTATLHAAGMQKLSGNWLYRASS